MHLRDPRGGLAAGVRRSGAGERNNGPVPLLRCARRGRPGGEGARRRGGRPLEDPEGGPGGADPAGRSPRGDGSAQDEEVVPRPRRGDLPLEELRGGGSRGIAGHFPGADARGPLPEEGRGGRVPQERAVHPPLPGEGRLASRQADLAGKPRLLRGAGPRQVPEELREGESPRQVRDEVESPRVRLAPRHHQPEPHPPRRGGRGGTGEERQGLGPLDRPGRLRRLARGAADPESHALEPWPQAGEHPPQVAPEAEARSLARPGRGVSAGEARRPPVPGRVLRRPGPSRAARSLAPADVAAGEEPERGGRIGSGLPAGIGSRGLPALRAEGDPRRRHLHLVASGGHSPRLELEGQLPLLRGEGEDLLPAEVDPEPGLQVEREGVHPGRRVAVAVRALEEDLQPQELGALGDLGREVGGAPAAVAPQRREGEAAVGRGEVLSRERGAEDERALAEPLRPHLPPQPHPHPSHHRDGLRQPHERAVAPALEAEGAAALADIARGEDGLGLPGEAVPAVGIGPRPGLLDPVGLGGPVAQEHRDVDHGVDLASRGVRRLEVPLDPPREDRPAVARARRRRGLDPRGGRRRAGRGPRRGQREETGDAGGAGAGGRRHAHSFRSSSPGAGPDPGT